MQEFNRNFALLAHVEKRLTSLAKKAIATPDNVLSHELVDLLNSRKQIRLMMTGAELERFDELYESH